MLDSRILCAVNRAWSKNLSFSIISHKKYYYKTDYTTKVSFEIYILLSKIYVGYFTHFYVCSRFWQHIKISFSRSQRKRGPLKLHHQFKLVDTWYWRKTGPPKSSRDFLTLKNCFPLFQKYKNYYLPDIHPAHTLYKENKSHALESKNTCRCFTKNNSK